MNEQESLSSLSVWGRSLGEGRISRVTLGLLLTTYLQDSPIEAHTYALARMQRATTGLISAASDYDAAVSTFATPLRPAATFQMWLTQYVTALGFSLGSKASLRSLRSTRLSFMEILSTSVGRHLFDAAEYMTRRERAEELTQWALGVGRFNSDMPLLTMQHRLWAAEQTLRRGSHPSSTTGLIVEE